MVIAVTCSASQSLNEIGVLTIKIMFFLREEECISKYNNNNNNNNNILTC